MVLRMVEAVLVLFLYLPLEMVAHTQIIGIYVSFDSYKHSNCELYHSNFDGYTNSIYTVTVAAIDRKNYHPMYSEECSANMIVMYSSGSGYAIVSGDKYMQKGMLIICKDHNGLGLGWNLYTFSRWNFCGCTACFCCICTCLVNQVKYFFKTCRSKEKSYLT